MGSPKHIGYGATPGGELELPALEESAESVAAETETPQFGAQPISLASTLLTQSDYGVPIPNILCALKDGLVAKNGHLVDAIFCAEPDAMKLESAQKRLDADASMNVTDLDALLIAGLIKRWFAMLPRRLLQDVSG